MTFENYSSVLKIYQDLESVNKLNKDAGLHDYSLINALLKANDEVRLHSKFIFSMINPKGSHYCDSVFLEKFLAEVEIELAEFIDCKNAHVYREKGNIDLLITDGNHFVIIENKLDAADQKYQITRYIQWVIKKFGLDPDEDLSKKIVIVYLSKTKSKPSEESKSIIGFRFEPRSNSEFLVWLNNQVHLNPDQHFYLKENTQFRYYHMNYFRHVRSWIKLSINWLESNHKNSNSLIHCFKEYEMILNRLDKSKRWKNKMSLDEYTLLIEEENQQQMYELMVDAQLALPKYVGRKLYEVISEKFNPNIYIKDEPIKYKEFNDLNCIKWFEAQGNKEKWNNVGFIFKDKNNEKWGLCLAEQYIYLAKIDLFNSTGSIKDTNTNGKIQISKKDLLENKKLPDFIDEFENRTKDIRLQ
ncbi:hypothetical protein JCM14076_20280 [Methylosoma difficile]